MQKPFEQFGIDALVATATGMQGKIQEAVDRILESPFPMNKAYVGHSGGKDSIVVRWLADLAEQKAGIVIPTVHSTKPPGVPNEVHELTRLFLYQQDRVITYAPLDKLNTLGYSVQIDGTRRAEFDRTNGRAVDVVIDGQQVNREHMPMYIPNGLFGLSFIYPIVDWSDLEVWSVIYQHQIPFSDEYLL